MWSQIKVGFGSCLTSNSRWLIPSGSENWNNLLHQRRCLGLNELRRGARGGPALDGGDVSGRGSRDRLLAESLEKRVTAPDTRRVILEGSVCLATPFRPSAPFSVGSAMARNKLIYASARTTLVVATDEGKGGTWEGAAKAMRHRYGHVSVWRGDGEGPGNAALAGKGARPIEAVEAAPRRARRIGPGGPSECPCADQPEPLRPGTVST